MKFLGDHRPANTLIPVDKLAAPDFLFEIEATAAILQYPTETVDVVVIGAGLSGLQTAVDLQKAGLKVKVIEARDRVGGKTWSRDFQGSICDVGAAWINDTNQERMYALAKRFGLELIPQNTDGHIICDEGIGNHKTHPYGELNVAADGSDQADIDDIIRIRDIFEETCHKIDLTNVVASGRKIKKDLDDITFELWLKSLGAGPAAVNALSIGTRAMLGVEPFELSALYFLEYCKSGGGYMQMRSDRKDGGQYLRIKSGTQSFSKSLASELESHSLVLMSPVRRVEDTGDGVRVTSARGIYEASRVVVSVPTPLYKEIAFHPALPPAKQALSVATKLGDYGKVILFFKTPWWRYHNLCGMSQTPHGPFSVTRDTSVDADEHYSLTCFMVGQPARNWAKSSASGRQEAVMAGLKRIFGSFAKVEEPIDFVEQIWRNE